VTAIQQILPGVKAVGTLYNSSEANSRKVVSVAREAFSKAGIRLEEVTITSSSEVLQAAQTLVARGIQAMWVTGDNTALQGFAAIGKAARDAKLPLFINDPEFAVKGAAVAVGLGWYESGLAAGKIAGRVLHGEKPAAIPFEEIAVKQLVINDDTVARLGLRIPSGLAGAATHVRDAK
jgi:putative ABC transport system substrate-binding protein